MQFPQYKLFPPRYFGHLCRQVASSYFPYSTGTVSLGQMQLFHVRDPLPLAFRLTPPRPIREYICCRHSCSYLQYSRSPIHPRRLPLLTPAAVVTLILVSFASVTFFKGPKLCSSWFFNGRLHIRTFPVPSLFRSHNFILLEFSCLSFAFPTRHPHLQY